MQSMGALVQSLGSAYNGGIIGFGVGSYDIYDLPMVGEEGHKEARLKE